MIKIFLKDNENGYDEVGKVVDKFIEKYGYGNVVITLIITHTPGETPDISNELLLYDDGEFVWENDWWEGQKYIKVVAIDFVQDVIISRYKLRQIEMEHYITEEQYNETLKIIKENKK